MHVIIIIEILGSSTNFCYAEVSRAAALSKENEKKAEAEKVRSPAIPWQLSIHKECTEIHWDITDMLFGSAQFRVSCRKHPQQSQIHLALTQQPVMLQPLLIMDLKQQKRLVKPHSLRARTLTPSLAAMVKKVGCMNVGY